MDKLDRIKEKCREIIALGENRTQGKWEWDGDASNATAEFRESAAPWLVAVKTDTAVITGDVFCKQPNAAFITAVAGPAEALARITLTAIEWFSEQNNEEALNEILAAWPDELL